MQQKYIFCANLPLYIEINFSQNYKSLSTFVASLPKRTLFMYSKYFFPILLFAAACMPEKQEKEAAQTKEIVIPKDTVVSLPEIPDTLTATESRAVTEKKQEKPEKPAVIIPTKKDTSQKKMPKVVRKRADLPLEQSLVEMGLVDIQTIDPSIKIDVKYSTQDNFMKADAYGDLNKIFLQKEVAEMLSKAHVALKKSYPNYRFIVFDGARPFRVQQKMWEIVKGTDMAHYVARPDAKGSMHNYGCAVDLSVVDEKGKELDMGTPFDFLGALAQTTVEESYIKAGKLTRKQVDNRLILRKAMESVGFTVLKREWWHFNAFPDATVLKKYKKIP